MLGVENHLVGALLHVGKRIGDDFQVGLLADPQIIAHVQVPGLADQSHHRRLRRKQRLEIDVLRRFDAVLPGGPEGRDLRMLQLEFFDLLEEIGVARVGARVPAFNVVDA